MRELQGSVTWIANFGKKKPRRLGWTDPKMRPKFFPDFLPWSPTNKVPPQVETHEWIPLLKRGIGESMRVLVDEWN